MTKIWIAAVSALLTAAVVPAVHAATPEPIELKGDVKVDKLVGEKGKERHVLVAPDVVVPGDKLVFATSYRNVGAVAVSNFVVTNPIPAGIALEDAGAAGLDVSVDGGKSWGKLAALRVAAADGTKRAALAGDVTHIRWSLPQVAPGGTGTVSYHAVVR